MEYLPYVLLSALFALLTLIPLLLRMNRMQRSLKGRLAESERRSRETQAQLVQSINAVTQLTASTTSAAESRMIELSDKLDARLAHLETTSDARLLSIEQMVNERLDQQLEKRLNSSFGQVSAQLEKVYRGLGEMQSLASGVGDLKKVLSGVKTRGIWGEVQLGALLSQMLAPDQYAQHAPVRPGGEPAADYVVVMPGQGHGHTVYLPIDASLPMREYTELRAALEHGSREDVDSARGLLESAVRMHARRMSEKLIAPPYTTDYGVLFLGSEGLYAEVLRISGLAERIQSESRMVIAGPTTFAALLQSLQMGFRSMAIEQRTEEIMGLLSAVRTDFGGFAGLLSRTQKRLRQASETIETAQRHSESIARRLSDVSELPGEQDRALLSEDTVETEHPFDDDDDGWD